MVKPVTQQLDSALTGIGGAAGQRTASVDSALGGEGEGEKGYGHAPAFIKAVGAHINRVPALLGKSHISHVFGTAEIPENGIVAPGQHLSVNLGDRKALRHMNDELRVMLLDLKKDLHNCEIQRQLLVMKNKMPMTVLDTPYFKAVVQEKLKAFQLSDFASWLPTIQAQFYFEELEMTPGVEKYFAEYPMMSQTVNVPGTTGRVKGKLVGDTTTYTAQYQTAASYLMTAQDCVAHTDITDDLLSDMVPNASAFERLRKEVALGVQRSKEDAIINGDDTVATSVQGDGHQDSDIAAAAATEFNKAFKGLRKRALGNASAVYNHAAAGANLAMYKGLLSKLGKNAKEKADLLVIVGSTIGNNVAFGNVTEILTEEKAGLRATIFNGMLPPIFGVEQYESEWVREDVNANGVYAASQVLTTVIAVKKSRFVIGKRAPMKIWATPSLANSDKMLLSAKERFSFGGPAQSATETTVAIARNVALT